MLKFYATEFLTYLKKREFAEKVREDSILCSDGVRFKVKPRFKIADSNTEFKYVITLSKIVNEKRPVRLKHPNMDVLIVRKGWKYKVIVSIIDKDGQVLFKFVKYTTALKLTKLLFYLDACSGNKEIQKEVFGYVEDFVKRDVEENGDEDEEEYGDEDEEEYGDEASKDDTSDSDEEVTSVEEYDNLV